MGDTEPLNPLQECVDAANQCVTDLGLDIWPHVVQRRVITWSGGEQGRGTKTVEDVTISPRPKVMYPSAAYQNASGGKTETGVRQIHKVSRKYSRDYLTGNPGEVTQEVFYLIDGDAYRLIGEPEKRTTEWRLRVERISKGRANL